MRRFSPPLVCLLVLLLSSCDDTLLQNVGEGQANPVLLALHRAGIAAYLERTGESGSIRVAHEDVGAALAVLEREALPQSAARGLGETFATSSLVPTPVEESVRVNSAVATELERTLASIDGVVSARVHLSIVDAPTLTLETTPPHGTASVLLRHQGAANISAAEVAALVAGAVQNVAANDVHVTFVEVAAPAAVHALTRVGPFSVARENASGLRSTLLILLATNIIALSIAAFSASKLSRARARETSTPT